MKRIYKYELEPQEIQFITLPIDSTILSVLEQNNNIMVYVLIDTEEIAKSDYCFGVYGTGHNITECIEDGCFIGTVKIENNLVFHVFHLNKEKY